MDGLEAFHCWLQDNDFEPDGSRSNWKGRVSVDWKDSETGQWQTSEHLITIQLPESFPYRAPVVFSNDNPPLALSWHLNPVSPPSLCLWDSETGWKPNFTANKLLNRIREWFFHYHTATWPADSQVPDLHLYLDKEGTVLIGDEWLPPIGTINGQFWLWQSAISRYSPYIAVCGENQSEPEARIANQIVFGANPSRLKGAWFRVLQPFAPPKVLGTLLTQIDNLSGKTTGWTLRRCIDSIGHKTKDTGLPIAIGYPDNSGQERWLFLWVQFPKQKGQRFKWSSPQNMRQIQVSSFQTAPVTKSALLRRSAHVSHSLTPKRVAVFGVGALGGSIALLLAKAGVGSFNLVDSDSLLPTNVMRHVCGLNYVGYKKTLAVKFVLQHHNPDCVVECLEATWNEARLSDYTKGCDLVIDATGNTNFSLYLNKFCLKAGQPVAVIAAYRRARVGRIITWLHHEDPCLACYFTHQAEWSEDEFPTIPASPEGGFIEDGCGSVTEEAVSLDVEAVANFGVRKVISILQGNYDGCNIGFIVNEPLPEVKEGLFSSAGVKFWTNRAHPDCSSCRI